MNIIQIPIEVFYKIPDQSVQLLSHVWLFAAHGLQHTSFSVHHQLPELAQIHVHQVGDAHPTIASSVIPFFLLPSIFSSIGVSSSESALHIRWPKYWSFSFSISPSSEYSGLISFQMDWLALLAVQGTLKSLIQHHISKAPIIWCSAFYSPTLTSLHDHWKNHSFG